VFSDLDTTPKLTEVLQQDFANCSALAEALVGATGKKLGSPGQERRTILPCEKPAAELKNHLLILWDVHVADGEIAYRDGRILPNML
jgi:hypothetical protein